jgi:hypothetical protein
MNSSAVIGGDGPQGLGGCMEQNIIDRLLILIGDGGDGLRDGEDDVEILGVEDLGLSILEPLGPGEGLAFRAVAIAAAVIGDAEVPAPIALIDVTAQRRGSAAFDRGHHATLGGG